jgi:hypothetical protein
VIDPDDESRVYTSRQVLSVDWSKPVQPTAEHVTWETMNFQDKTQDEWADPRYGKFIMPMQAIKYQGKTFVYLTTQKGRSMAWVYRVDGHQLVPGGYYGVNVFGGWGEVPGGNSWPHANPLGRSWGSVIWSDADGDQTWRDDPDEFQAFSEFWRKSTGTVDAEGTIWFLRGNEPGYERILGRLEPKGLTPQGFPDYRLPHDDLTEKMPPLHHTYAMEYDPENNVMYFMAREKEGEEVRLHRYNDFPANPEKAWSSEPIPWEDKSFTPRFGYGAGTAKCPKHAGDYVFVPYGYGGWVRVYHAADGRFVTTLKPNTIPSGGAGDVDAHHALNAHQRKNGEYILFVESAGQSRVTVYRWRPREAE